MCVVNICSEISSIVSLGWPRWSLYAFSDLPASSRAVLASFSFTYLTNLSSLQADPHLITTHRQGEKAIVSSPRKP